MDAGVEGGVEMGADEAAAEKAAGGGRRCSLLGRLLFSWFGGYVAKGKAKALTPDEIPELEEEFRYASERASARVNYDERKG